MIIWNVVKLFYDAHVCLTNTNSRIWGKHVAGQACTEWQRDDWVSVTRYGVQPSFKLCVILGLVQPYTGSWLLVSRFYIYIYIYYCMCWYIYIYLLLISSQGLMSINFSRFWLGWKLSSPISDGTPAKLQAPVEEQLKVKVDKDDDDGVVDQVLCQSQSQGCLGFWCDQLSSKVKYVTRIPQTPHLRHYLALFRCMILHHHHHRHLQNRHPRRKLPERNWNHSRWRRNCLRSLADLATNWCSCPSQYQGRINEAVEAIKVKLFHSTCELWFVKVGAKTTLNSQHIYKSSIWMV
jgi:hypothetical protein